MKKGILIAIVYTIVYIIIFAMEILVYYIYKESAIYFFGLITLVAFIFTLAVTLNSDNY
jgi:hypothetical protein